MSVCGIIEICIQELLLFSGVGFLIGAVDEAVIDLMWLVRRGWRRLTVYRSVRPMNVERLPLLQDGVRFAAFIPAWDEAGVIGAMLERAKRAYADDAVHLFVGCYPNDPQTIAAASTHKDGRLNVVIVNGDGPTTKANCLNQMYQAMSDFETSEGYEFAGVILHDAEDVVSASEARVFGMLVDRFGMIQLPVVPLIDPDSPWVSGHYCDEFAESHIKTQVVREALGAALPGAGVGCMIRRDVLALLADLTNGAPFEEDSLTEDYELGLRLGSLGFRSAFVRVEDAANYGVVATSAYFPSSVRSAIKQKARWMTGISLAGWDRLGWGTGWIENWMRLRDRKGILSAFTLCAAYLGAVLAIAMIVANALVGSPMPQVNRPTQFLLAINLAILLWRFIARFYFVSRIYGWRQGLIALPRTFVGNVIAIGAAFRAIQRYLQMLRNGRVEWDKTTHKFPQSVAES